MEGTTLGLVGIGRNDKRFILQVKANDWRPVIIDEETGGQYQDGGAMIVYFDAFQARERESY